MQLKNIRKQLGSATCVLLQVATPAQADAASATADKWDVDSAALFYSESDGRVSAFEPAVYAGRNFGEDDRLDVRAVVDVLTGASPNGAHASSTAQTFTRPSGAGSYTAAAGETPLDDTFRDTRIAMGADWTMQLDRLDKLKLGANFSTEHDYLSLGLSANYSRDFNNRNTTLTTGLAFNNDTITPEGTIPTEFAPMVVAGSTLNRRAADDSKTLTDFMIGVTQVIDRKTLLQLNYTLGSVDGYQNDPYKIITVIDPLTGLPATASGSAFFDTATTSNRPYVYENRPDSRKKNSLFLKGVHYLDEDVINLSYRYYWDDWEITSHTIDLKYRYQMGDGYLQPHVRYYKQDAAEFYTHDLSLGSDVDATTGAVNRQFASNDYRLAASTTTTIGLKYGIPMGSNSEFSTRVELITQSVDDGSVPAGEETSNLDALVLQVSYSLLW